MVRSNRLIELSIGWPLKDGIAIKGLPDPAEAKESDHKQGRTRMAHLLAVLALRCTVWPLIDEHHHRITVRAAAWARGHWRPRRRPLPLLPMQLLPRLPTASASASRLLLQPNQLLPQSLQVRGSARPLPGPVGKLAWVGLASRRGSAEHKRDTNGRDARRQPGCQLLPFQAICVSTALWLYGSASPYTPSASS